VIALGQPSRDHVPYRQTKLTNVLKDSLGGNTKTVLIANVWAEPQCLEETISTLKFATRMMLVRNDVSRNVIVSPEQRIRALEREVADLKAELMMTRSFAGQSGSSSSFEPLSDNDRHETQKSILAYVRGEQDEDPLMAKAASVSRFREIMGIFREVFRTFGGVRTAVTNQNAANGIGANNSGGSNANQANHASSGAHGVTGGEQPAAEFLQRRSGKSNLDGTSSSMDHSSVMNATNNGDNNNSGNGLDSSNKLNNTNGGSNSNSNSNKPSKNEAFEDYKSKEGAELNGQLKEGLVQLKEKKRIVKELSQQVNDTAREIEQFKSVLDAKRGSSNNASNQDADGEIILDEEEFAVFRDMKAAKKKYKEAYTMLKEAKSEAEYLSRMTEQAKAQLVTNFENWYAFHYEQQGSGSSSDDIDHNMNSTSGNHNRSASNNAQADMDEAEKFEQLEMEKILSEDPESAAFYRAKKQLATHGKGGKNASFNASGSMKRR
jgi:kinesin family protein 6/9